MLATKESENHAYDQASQVYWDGLYEAVREDAEAYNASHNPLAHVVVGGSVVANGVRTARQFTIEHIQKWKSPTEVERHTEKRPHTLDIVCYVENSPHRLILKLGEDGDIEGLHSSLGKLTLPEVVALIVGPLKKLGAVPNHEADPPPSPPEDYESL